VVRPRGVVCGFLAGQLACLLLLSACDSTSPALAPTPTLVSEASPETGNPNAILTALPPASAPSPVPSPNLSEAERVGLYTQVVATLLKGESVQTVYVSPYVGQGVRLDEPDESTPLPSSLLPALQLADTKRKYELLDFAQAVGPLDDGGEVADGGVYLTLGPITASTEKNTLFVRASIYRKVGSAEGNLYRFGHDASGGWKLLDVTPEWSDQQ
jgi:hypothetical protein